MKSTRRHNKLNSLNFSLSVQTKGTHSAQPGYGSSGHALPGTVPDGLILQATKLQKIKIHSVQKMKLQLTIALLYHST